MRDYTYRVWFTTGITQTVTCFSANEAAILACAEEIKAGRRYDYNKIERQNDDGSWWDIRKPSQREV